MILVGQSGQRFALQVGDNIVGRGVDCQVRLEQERVSRRHAVIQWDGQAARITDLSSTNGTLLNGRLLTPYQAYPLAPGDHLEVGGPQVALEVSTGLEPASAVQAAAARPARRTPLWLWVMAGLVIVGLGFGVAALIGANRSQNAANIVVPTGATPAPAATSAPGSPSSAAAAANSSGVLNAVPTATLAPLPPAPKPAAVGAGAVQPAAGQAPPVNPATLPGLVSTTTAGLLPADVANILGGTPVPGTASGTPGSSLPSLPKRRTSPQLLSPANGSSYQGADAVIMLEWKAVDGLASNEYYWVMVFYQRDGKEQAGGTWVKATSYRVPSWFLSQASGRFEWQVVIAEATGPVESGGRLGATVSERSERRWFDWQPGGEPPAAQSPEPPVPLPSPTYGG